MPPITQPWKRPEPLAISPGVAPAASSRTTSAGSSPSWGSGPEKASSISRAPASGRTGRWGTLSIHARAASAAASSAASWPGSPMARPTLRRLRVWIDITNSPHVVIFRPLIARLRARGCEVTVTAREFAQTIGLLERFGIEHVSVGAHGGASSAGKARAMAGRSAALVRFARRARFDLAVAHGSTDQPLAARAAGTPQVTMFDYEYATVMHHWNGRLATRVLVPSAIPEEALAPYGMRPPKLVRYPGLKEEYYLADHAMDEGVLGELGLDPARLIAVMRPPPEVTLYHRGASSDLFAATLERLLAAPEVQTVVLPRTGEQRAALAGGAAIVPGRPIDGPSASWPPRTSW